MNKQINLQLEQKILEPKSYSKHWEFPIVVKKGLLLSQLLILAQTLAEKVPDAGMAS